MATRFQNKVRILGLLRELGQVPRPALSERLNINLPTISNLTKELIGERLIRGGGFGKSEGGRRAELLELNPAFATAIGLELSLTGIRGVLADMGGHVLDREEGPRQVPGSKEAMIDAVLGVAETLCARAPQDRRPIGAGLSVAGLTDERGRVSREFPRREAWKEVPLARLLEKRLGLPAGLENDVQAATLAERRHGASRGVENVLYLHIGHGIACGIVVGGRLYTGATRNAGEFGHTIVDAAGPICYCGNYGCLESLASPTAIIDQTLQAIRKGVNSTVAASAHGDLAAVTLETIFKAAVDGDRLATNVVTKAAEYIGLGLANLVNFFNPNLVVFGGEILVSGHRIFNEAIERTFRGRVLPILQRETRVGLSTLGRDASALGGSMVVFEDLFDRPDRLFALARGQRPQPEPEETGERAAETRQAAARARSTETSKARGEEKAYEATKQARRRQSAIGRSAGKGK